VLGALAHGLPLVMLPNGSGTDQTAEACADAGVAVTSPLERVTATILGTLVVDALDRPELRSASAALGRSIRELGGAAAAAGHVLDAITSAGTTNRSRADRETPSRACSPGTPSSASSSPPRA
jgi:UDP:flavonoid glycosyltransferase YjiC (YdhE family)